MSFEYTIRPRSGILGGWKEIWQFRELAYMMAWREIKVKYKQAFFGILWAVIQPVFMAMVFYFLFKDNPPVSRDSGSYMVYVLSGMVIWNFFSGTVQNSIQQILGYSQIIKKIYFPRIYIPFSSFLIAGFDFLFGFLVLFIFLFSNFGFEHVLQINWLMLLLSIFMLFLISNTLSIYLSSLVVKYRDFKYATNFIIQIFFFISPVFYDGQGRQWPFPWLIHFFEWHPIGIPIEVFRASLNGMFVWGWKYGLFMIILIFLFLLSVLNFRKTEEIIADRI
ncbi:MAG: ABC transporter permease [Bacteroidia bacterium]|nr:ABC transporter permease [Bacteroidia bacterium]